MDYKIEIDKRAVKALKKLPLDVRRRLVRLIDSLASNPHPSGAKCLHDPKGVWRIRKGNYRIAYVIKKDKLIVLIVHIADRKEFYRQLRRLKITR